MNFSFFSDQQDQDILKKYARNMNDDYLSGKINSTIGREEEIRRVIEILSRKEKNNPVLIGEPGVGKTAIVEGLVKRIINNDVPNNIRNVQIYELSLSSIMAGASFQGEFERRIMAIINEVKKSNGEIILFIDEIHQLMGMGKISAQAGMDAANILKPMLARSEIKLIGATTNEEYRKFIEKDSAFERRFQKVIVNEPTREEALTILRGLKEKWELFHKVKILDSALVAAVNLSDRYINNKYLPDKAIDLIDEAAAKINTQINSSPIELDKLNRKIGQLEMEKHSLKKETDERAIKRLNKISDELEELKKEQKILDDKWNEEKAVQDSINKIKQKIEKNNALVDKYQLEENYAEASKLLYQTIPELETKLKELEEQSLKTNSILNVIVSENEIADIVSKITRIPLTKLMENDKEKMLNLDKELKKKVIGQDHAIDMVSKSIQRSRVGINDPTKPIGSFLFIGPTGVGKTEVAKSLADILFNNENDILRLDMSEYMEKHSVSKLIGAPPGYVGYDQAGILSEKVRQKPYIVILFDEIEKAHPDVLNILLQILDDGRLTDSQGRLINFKNTIIIMTSNVGGEYITNNNDDKVESELKKYFKPEFLNRIDDIVKFNKLNTKDVEQIAQIALNKLSKRLSENDYLISFNNSVASFVAKNGYDDVYGARPVNRFIKHNIEDFLALNILNNSITKNKKYEIIYDNNELKINSKKNIKK